MRDRLDKESRATIWRFIIKLVVSLILGTLGEIGRTVGADGWLALYALWSGAVALMKGQRFPSNGFNYWDEALWLVAASAGLAVYLRLIA